jgi:ketosteroid isomerase-like protein
MKSWGYTLLIISLSFGIATCVKVSDETQTREIIQGFEEAYEKEDINKLMSYFSDDCEQRLFNSEGEMIESSTEKETVKSTFAAEFSRGDGMEVTITNMTVEISDDAAIVNYDWQLNFTDRQANGVRIVSTGTANTSFRKVEDAWKIKELKRTIDTWEESK